MLFDEDWLGESGTSGYGVDGDGNNIYWSVSSSRGISYFGDLLFSDTDGGVTWSVTIPGGNCSEAFVTFSIYEGGDLDGFCSLGSATCECRTPVGGTNNSDYADVYINGDHLSSAYCSTSCSETNCPGYCSVSDGYTLSGDCSGGTVVDDDWGWEDFFETVYNNGNDISIDITASTNTTSEEIGVTQITVDCTVLAVDFEDFQVTAQEGGIQVTWSTQSEIDNDYFLVERSRDGIVFQSIGTVEGGGTTFNRRTYRLIDPHPLKGTNYYRIKQFDLDGKVHQTQVQAIQFNEVESVKKIRVFPNPVDAELQIEIYSDKVNRRFISIQDVFGRQILNFEPKFANSSIFSVDVRNLSPGNYLVKYVEGEVLRTGKFVKK